MNTDEILIRHGIPVKNKNLPGFYTVIYADTLEEIRRVCEFAEEMKLRTSVLVDKDEALHEPTQ